MGGAGDGVDLRRRACVFSFCPCASRAALSPLGSFAIAYLPPDFFHVWRRAISSRLRLSAVASPCVAACRLVVLSRLRFELIKTAHLSTIASRLVLLAPFPVPSCRHAYRPLVFPSVGACRSSSFASTRPRLPPIVPPHLTHRLPAPPWRVEKRGGDGCLAGLCYMSSCGVICPAFLLYIGHSCYIFRILVIYRAFLLYLSHSCYISSVPVIWLAFLLYVQRSCYLTDFVGNN